MKLIIWNKANSYSPTTYAQCRTIRVNRHEYIYLSGALTAEIELLDGCRLNLANDEENPKDCYLCRTQQEEGFRLRGDRPGKMFLRALPRRQRARRGRRCEILQNSYRQPDSRHAEKHGEEITARQDMLLQQPCFRPGVSLSSDPFSSQHSLYRAKGAVSKTWSCCKDISRRPSAIFSREYS